MYSLSVLTRMRGWQFDYFVDHIPEYLRVHPQGNYLGALQNGTIFHESKWDDSMSIPDDTLLIHEGGRQQEAEEGIRLLANEIEEWRRQKGIEKLSIFLPAGTGTTALYLQKHSNCRVYTTPCVGDADYLKAQFGMLGPDPSFHPTILTPNKKYHFGKLYKEHYDLWQKLKGETRIEFDLLYDPIGWRTLLEHSKLFDGEILYIHQGGLLGNESMIPRYQRKYPNL